MEGSRPSPNATSRPASRLWTNCAAAPRTGRPKNRGLASTRKSTPGAATSSSPRPSCPTLTLNLQERLATTLPAVAVIATAQAWTVWRLTKHARRMRGAADELAEQWNADVSAVEARARGEPHAAIKFRPWALPAAPAPAAKH